MVSQRTLNQRLGHNLRKLRMQKGFMQIDLAVAADTDRSYISRVETGQARATFRLLYRLVKALEVTSADLIDDYAISFAKEEFLKGGGES